MLRRQLGNAAENYVATMLQTQGYTLHAGNYAWRGGEIDIIAQKGNVLAFIEVKMRQHHYFALSEIITPSKQRKIIATARKYIHAFAAEQEMIYRFDVALLELLADGTYATTYLPNAFTAPIDIL